MAQTAPLDWIDRARSALDTDGGRQLLAFLQRQRWFGGKGRPVVRAYVWDVIALSREPDRLLLGLVGVDYRDGQHERYAMPLVIRADIQEGDPGALVSFPGSPPSQWVCDATGDAAPWVALCQDIMQSRERSGQSGSLKGRAVLQGKGSWADSVREVKVLSGEQSNTSVVCDQRIILKLLRKVEAGLNPDGEMLEFLTTHPARPSVPTLLGVITYEEPAADQARTATVALLERFVPGSVDGWKYALAHLDTLLNEGSTRVRPGDIVTQVVEDLSGPFLSEIRLLGETTGALHVALSAEETLEAFRPEPITALDVEQWKEGMAQRADAVCRELRALDLELRRAVGLTDDELTRLPLSCHRRWDALYLLVRAGAAKIRHHGDYHLGQVLKTDDGFVVIDFEGEPARPLDERRAKLCPLKDVGGMLRSFSYAGQVALRHRPGMTATGTGLIAEWEQAARAAFLTGYRAATERRSAGFLPAGWDEALRVVRAYELDKALYELTYELRNRPDWLCIPLTGLRRLIDGAGA